MSDANAKSSKTPVKNEDVKIDARALEIVGGPMSIQSERLIMDPEIAFSYTVEMVDLVKSVGTYSEVLDENGKIKQRVDNKTGYVLDKSSIDRAIKESKNERDI